MSEAEGLLLSAAIEAVLAYGLARLARWPCRGPVHVGLASAVATAVTHPQAWELALRLYPRWGGSWTALAVEAAVVAAEALLIAWMAQLRLDRAALVSLIANSASWAAGALIG